MADNELVLISPEGLEVAQAYLACGHDVHKTATELQLPVSQVSSLLDKREVKTYIDRVFAETGFRNREKMGQVWDAVLASKLEEMEETGLGSGKDVVEILEKMHKFKMQELEMELKLRSSEKPQVQVNTQNNYGDNYNKLLEKLTDGS